MYANQISPLMISKQRGLFDNVAGKIRKIKRLSVFKNKIKFYLMLRTKKM